MSGLPSSILGPSGAPWFVQNNGRTCVVRPEESATIWLIRGATRRGVSNFSELEANASAHLDLPVASWFFLR
jgi:hypothetical protein